MYQTNQYQDGQAVGVVMLTIHKSFNIRSDMSYGDKSITHRALILASIAEQPITISNMAINKDTMATVSCLQQLGATITIEGTTAIVKPIDSLPQGNIVLDCANSGTTARLMLGLVCGLNVSATFVGDSSLSQRPMDRVIQPLQQMGANIDLIDGALFVTDKHEGLTAIDYNMAVPSAQVKSAILIAGLFAQGKTTVRESVVSRNHTEIMMHYLGCDISINAHCVTVGQSRPKSLPILVPNDMSTAVFLVMASMDRGIRLNDVGINPTRTGAIELLAKAKANIGIINRRTICGELIGDIVLKPTNPNQMLPMFLHTRDSARTIDEIPVLALLATRIMGESVFQGVVELRYKESNRLQSIIEMCSAMQIKAFTTQQGDLCVLGKANRVVECAKFSSYGDHRMAMCNVVASTMSQYAVIDDQHCIAVSCPNFFQLLGCQVFKLALIGDNIGQSLSPTLMSVFARATDLNISYDLVQMDSTATDEELLNAINQYDGVNITMPFKQRVAQLTKAKCKAVNTVGKGIAPVSTDGYGFVLALKYNDVKLRGKNILVVGAGGVAWTIVEQLLNCGAKVNIVNRTQSKADIIEKHFAIDYKLSHFDGIVSCIPVCDMEKDIEITADIKFVFSAEYKQTSNLIIRAKQMGIKTIDGLDMLYYQGRKSFELWTGIRPEQCYEQFVKIVRGNNEDTTT